jgi:hypothetical protein
MFIRKNLGSFHRSCEGGETSSQNSLWGIYETMRTVGSIGVTGWLEAGELITLGSRINMYC